MSGKQFLWRAVQVALVVLITWGIVRTLAPELAKVSADDFSRFRPAATLLILATALLLVFYLLHAWLWRGITADLTQAWLPYRRALHIYFVSGLGRYIPGKFWQVAGMAVLAQRAGISPVAATAAAVIAQFAFITTGLVYLALVLPAWGGLAPLLLAAAALLLVILLYRSRHWAGSRFKRLQPSVDMLDRLTVRNALKWWLAYGVSWIILGVAFVVFVRAFVPLGWEQQRQVAGAVAAAYLGGLLAFFSIAGLGVREAVMGSLLVTVMPAPAALVVSVASRIWFTAGELLPILFAKRNS